MNISEVNKDLRECVKVLLAQGSDVAPDGSAAMYGMASVRLCVGYKRASLYFQKKIPDRRIVADLASYFIECNMDIRK